jgi:hypothetical protein
MLRVVLASGAVESGTHKSSSDTCKHFADVTSIFHRPSAKTLHRPAQIIAKEGTACLNLMNALPSEGPFLIFSKSCDKAVGSKLGNRKVKLLPEHRWLHTAGRPRDAQRKLITLEPPGPTDARLNDVLLVKLVAVSVISFQAGDRADVNAATRQPTANELLLANVVTSCNRKQYPARDWQPPFHLTIIRSATALPRRSSWRRQGSARLGVLCAVIGELNDATLERLRGDKP